jgi:hypothetical protein
MYRRELLSGLTASVSLLAGCASVFDNGTTNTDTNTETDAKFNTDTQQSMTTTDSTATAIATVTATKTATEMTTTTQTIPATTTATPTMNTTGTATTNTETALIDPSQLTAYTNSDSGYRIMYPSHWSLDDSETNSVNISSPRRSGYMQITTIKDISPSTSLDTAVSDYITGFTKPFNDMKIQDQRDITLSDGTPAKEVVATIIGTENNPFLKLQSRFLFVIANGNLYAVNIFVEGDEYTKEIKRAVFVILESFSVT